MNRCLKLLAFLVAVYLVYRIISEFFRPVTVTLDDRIDAAVPFRHPLPTPESATVMDSAPGRININKAGVSALVTLPGIGPTLAERIVAYRQHIGPFSRAEELAQVQGIGLALAQRLSALILID